MAVDQYLRQVGHETERLGKAALLGLLLQRYLADPNLATEEQVGFVLGGIANAETGERLTEAAAKSFCAQRPEMLRRYAASNPLLEQRTALHTFLYQIHAEKACLGPENSAAALAAAVTNMVFGEEPADEQQASFESENAGLVEILARRLAKEGSLSEVLSGAAYNTCYARYLEAGGKRGLINPYLGYVRAVSRGNWDAAASGAGKIEVLGKGVLAPIRSMSRLGIFRPLPSNPDERALYKAVRDLYENVMPDSTCPPIHPETQPARENREERPGGSSTDPDIVCNGYPGGRGAEVWGFNGKALSWLKENVHAGRWVLGGKALQVPVEEVSRIVTNASAAGLVVKTNNI